MIRLNLLPKNLRRRVEPGWWRLVAALFALVVFLVLGFLHYTAYTELSLAKEERDALRAEVEALRPFIQEQNRLQQERKALEALLAIREGLRKNFVPWSEYLATFINQIPREGGRFPVALRSVGTRALTEEEAAQQAQNGAFDGKKVRVEFTLQGEALNQGALVRFIQAFEASPRFGIEFQGASLDQNRGLYTFSARVGVVGGEQGAR
ncbi:MULTISPECIES: flagellar protein FliT [Thermus]|uniref:Competence protein n=1 Tax=Thermus brockianus TaxID=56956 RepID=A0A1J0LSP2_THEBO|nr:flagellar protein FliT [Thermus brockianus]APD09377.1 competence protein PilN [Thermus brockianus]BDG17360.1 competence protein [Thermus brockianus]